MVSRQLDLGFENRPGLKAAGRGRNRSRRADWWFAQMRVVVNEARDWPPAPAKIAAPQPQAEPADAGPSPRVTTLRAAGPAPRETTADAQPTPEPHRWRVSRARRLIWE